MPFFPIGEIRERMERASLPVPFGFTPQHIFRKKISFIKRFKYDIAFYIVVNYNLEKQWFDWISSNVNPDDYSFKSSRYAELKKLHDYPLTNAIKIEILENSRMNICIYFKKLQDGARFFNSFISNQLTQSQKESIEIMDEDAVIEPIITNTISKKDERLLLLD